MSELLISLLVVPSKLYFRWNFVNVFFFLSKEQVHLVKSKISFANWIQLTSQLKHSISSSQNKQMDHLIKMYASVKRCILIATAKYLVCLTFQVELDKLQLSWKLYPENYNWKWFKCAIKVFQWHLYMKGCTFKVTF